MGKVTAALMNALLARDVALGKELSLVTTSFEAPGGEACPITPSGTRIPWIRWGEAAARALLAVLSGKQELEKDVTIQRTWREGMTLGPAPTNRRGRLRSGNVGEAPA